MDAARTLAALGEPVATRTQLLRAGATSRDLTAAVRSRSLVRVREGYYASPVAEEKLLQAVRIGGRLGCISALEQNGVWVIPHLFAHVSMESRASRMRSPRNRLLPLAGLNRDGCELHWAPTPRADASVHTSSVVNALSHAVRCQPAELAIAALDSALYGKLVTPAEVHSVFSGLPKHFAPLESRIDARCMSGIETIIRLELVALGIPFETQVRFPGIGVVDFVVAGCVVVETDGRGNHDGETYSARDYDRDAKLAARGYIVVRLNYRQVMFERELAIAAILGALRSHRRGPAA
ncbi:very-short-patch-repair endonuclease [Conyzicola lurida]|uniref:Very-short-patch-repair endonuclease n=1 Tax=Conyzicola lurida TaxID=1172621 RepID=A0A841APR4_9MICO|nr:DUF559 domain-containing protein [Conyzicola lurida]MBB5844284.1 very-short-patch-repair endonuclease [Conyzicola lurida]